MSGARNWKDTFVSGMYASGELREQKALLCLLGYIVHRTHSKLRMCWVSQRTLAEASNCNERNVKRMLASLQALGAIGQVRFSALPPTDRAAINAVSPAPINKNSNVYFPCLGWAEDKLEARAPAIVARRKPIRISKEDMKRGSEKAADRRRRYAHKDLAHPPTQATVPDHEEYLFLNAVNENGGRSVPPILEAKGGRSTTRIYIDYNPAANSALNNGKPVGAPAPHSSQANTRNTSISSLLVQHGDDAPHSYGAGEASACVPRPQALARPEGTEYDAAGAREERGVA